MFNIFKNVINSTSFDLDSIETKINTNWVQSRLSDDEREELLELARSKADPANSLAPIQEQIDDLRARVEALEGTTSEEVEEFPEWTKPEDKAHYYKQGDTCTYNGVHYWYVGTKASGYDPITYPYPYGWANETQYNKWLAEQVTTE